MAKTQEGTPLPDNDRTRWLMKHESLLRILARHEINQRFAGKFDPSDVVQQTLMEAWRGWEHLQATDEPQRAAWLRQILAHQIARFVRHHQGTQKRDISREWSLEQSLECSMTRSSTRLESMVIAQDPSPSQAAIALEQKSRLAKILDNLPDDYRTVILLRNFEDLSHEEIAKRMGRSDAAVRMLWLRALAALTKAISDQSL